MAHKKHMGKGETSHQGHTHKMNRHAHLAAHGKGIAHESHHENNKEHGMPCGFCPPDGYKEGPQNPEGNETHS